MDILNASTGRNNSTENKFYQFILSEPFASGFSLSLMIKDIGIARQLAHSVDMLSPLLEKCHREWQAARAELPEGADHTAFIRYLERVETR